MEFNISVNRVNIMKTWLVWMRCGQSNHEDHVPHTRTGHYNNYSEFSLTNVLYTSTPALANVLHTSTPALG